VITSAAIYNFILFWPTWQHWLSPACTTGECIILPRAMFLPFPWSCHAWLLQVLTDRYSSEMCPKMWRAMSTTSRDTTYLNICLKFFNCTNINLIGEELTLNSWTAQKEYSIEELISQLQRCEFNPRFNLEIKSLIKLEWDLREGIFWALFFSAFFPLFTFLIFFSHFVHFCPFLAPHNSRFINFWAFSILSFITFRVRPWW
jgi:hypothetical protein